MDGDNCCVLGPYFLLGTLLNALHLFNLHHSPSSVDIIRPSLQIKRWKLVLSHIAYERQGQDSDQNLGISCLYFTVQLGLWDAHDY